MSETVCAKQLAEMINKAESAVTIGFDKRHTQSICFWLIL